MRRLNDIHNRLMRLCFREAMFVRRPVEVLVDDAVAIAKTK